MAGRFPKIQRGAPLGEVTGAAYHNAIRDAIAWVDAQRNGIGQGGAQKLRPPAGVVWIRNDASGNRDRFEVLGINGPAIEPIYNLGQFQQNFPLKGVAPAAGLHEGRFAITLEAIPNGEFGFAMLSGIIPCQVAIGDADEPNYNIATLRADIVDGVTANLKVSAGGSAEVLWIESGTGTKWAIVRLGVRDGQMIFEATDDYAYRTGGDCCWIFSAHRIIWTAVGMIRDESEILPIGVCDQNLGVIGASLFPFWPRIGSTQGTRGLATRWSGKGGTPTGWGSPIKTAWIVSSFWDRQMTAKVQAGWANFGGVGGNQPNWSVPLKRWAGGAEVGAVFYATPGGYSSTLGGSLNFLSSINLVAGDIVTVEPANTEYTAGGSNSIWRIVSPCLDAAYGTILPVGLLYSIPRGWAKCDGTSPTPDLRGRGLVGIGSAYSGDSGVGAGAGGYAKHGTTENNHADHTAHTHTLSKTPLEVQAGTGATVLADVSADNANLSAHSDTDNRDPHYGLDWMMRVS
jgi:hypothetical protein